MGSFKSRKSSAGSRERNASRSPPAASPPLPSCLRSPSITSASAALSSPPEAEPSPAASFGSLGAGNTPPTSTSPPNTSDASSPTPTPSCDASLASPLPSPNADSSSASPPRPPRPFPALSLIYTSPIQSTSSTVSTPLSSSPSFPVRGSMVAWARAVPEFHDSRIMWYIFTSILNSDYTTPVFLAFGLYFGPNVP
ncbi:hypothetical protein K438DRAFT_1980422 [Mycena galopus ATCC 62051]|nr:hypothetical protein K438DRAFT_1980422 [Mycena galopus ATCC 62051]